MIVWCDFQCDGYVPLCAVRSKSSGESEKISKSDLPVRIEIVEGIISSIGLRCTEFLDKKKKISESNGSVAIKIEMVNGVFFMCWRVNLPGKGLIGRLQYDR